MQRSFWLLSLREEVSMLVATGIYDFYGSHIDLQSQLQIASRHVRKLGRVVPHTSSPSNVKAETGGSLQPTDWLVLLNW